MSDLRKFFGGTPAATPNKPAPKEPSKPAAEIEVPRDLDGHRLPDKLVTKIEHHPAPEIGLAWALPGMLSWGAPAWERSDPQQWLERHRVRLVIDLSYELKQPESYKAMATRARLALVNLPINSRVKIPPATVVSLAALQRVVLRMLADAERGSPGEPRLAVHVCDSRGGGIAAFFVAPLVAIHTGCSLVDSCVYVSRLWRDKTVNISNNGGLARVFPEGEWLRRAILASYNKLREQPLAATVSSTVLAALETPVAKMAARLLDVDQTLFLVRPEFTRTEPQKIVEWAAPRVQYKKKTYVEAEEEEEKPRWKRRYRESTSDDESKGAGDYLFDDNSISDD